ncbi:MAG: low molecular weight protein-tyrosine-phosphatase [Actinomycetes bacterium]|jgi:protein-tyrosine phosphatase|nr:low molecular weight phosphotyrosine protein phosphatase [Acidimicrobiia bacterium]
MPDEKALKILVVCLGNICRSPAGEAALKEAASRAGLRLEVESAGTGPWHVGEPPDPQIRAAGRRAGLEIDGVGRQITSAADLEPYDVILAMDRSNLHALRRIAPELEDRMYLYRSFDPDADSDEMPDPWGMDDAAFDDTIRWARSAAEGIVEAIRSGRIP